MNNNSESNLVKLHSGRRLQRFVPCAAVSRYVVLRRIAHIMASLVFVVSRGCGTTTQKSATEQLLMSDAVDKAVSQLDFSALSGRKVFLDTTYLNQVKGIGFVNSSYIISSLRQQMLSSRCLIQDSKLTADVIVEARVGSLGTNGHEIVYGLPATSGLSTAASIFMSGPTIPIIPEVSLGKSDAQSGIAKISLFAYDRETSQPIWQSGIAQAESRSRNTWFLGAGPFQRGSIHEGIRFAGDRVDKLERARDEGDLTYFQAHEFEPVDEPSIKVAENPGVLQPK